MLIDDITFEYIMSSFGDTSEDEGLIIKKLNKILVLHVSIYSNSTNQLIRDGTGAMFIVQVRPNRPPIIFGKATLKSRFAPSSFRKKLDVP